MGQRLVAHNPQLTDADRAAFVEPDPQTWKHVIFFMIDQRLLTTRVQLLRPPHWLEEHNVKLHAYVPLSLPEFGVEGDFLVTSIYECPKIQPGPGAVVTGKFAHEVRGKILAVTVEGVDKPITVTPNHPFWSEDAQDFVEVGDMSPGATVRLADGQLRRLTNIETRAGPSSIYTVYNLEVAGEHVYHVSTAGVTVHNKGGHGSSAMVPKAPSKLGEWGEQRLRIFLGGSGFKPSKAFSTSDGPRYIDRLVDGVAHEAKAGINVKLGASIERQILKDAELVRNRVVKEAHWHFFQGATDDVLNFLNQHGIKYTLHPTP